MQDLITMGKDAHGSHRNNSSTTATASDSLRLPSEHKLGGNRVLVTSPRSIARHVLSSAAKALPGEQAQTAQTTLILISNFMLLSVILKSIFALLNVILKSIF